MKDSAIRLLNGLGEFLGWLILAPFVAVIGGLAIWQVVSAVLIPAWLIWEFWPFDNEQSQTLAYVDTFETETAVMKKINEIEFEIDIGQQRVIQKIVAPLRSDKRILPLCLVGPERCADYIISPEEQGLGEIQKNLPTETDLLTELQNCTVKSPKDWICKSDWYYTSSKPGVAYIGKVDGEWISNPAVSRPLTWKADLAFKKFRCEDSVCFVMTRKEREQLRQRIMKSMRASDKKDQN